MKATWFILDKHLDALFVFSMRCSRCSCGIPDREHVSNQDVLLQCESTSVKSQLRSKRPGWCADTCRIPDTGSPKNAVALSGSKSELFWAILGLHDNIALFEHLQIEVASIHP